MEVVHARCCGLDGHKKSVVACVLITQPDGNTERYIRTFKTMTTDLVALSDWLSTLSVSHVALEPIHLVGGQTLKVVADHALAEARLVAYLALTGKGDATISGSPRQPQHDKLACRRQIQFPNPCSHLVAHGRRRPIVNGACEHLLSGDLELGTTNSHCRGRPVAAQSPSRCW